MASFCGILRFLLSHAWFWSRPGRARRADYLLHSWPWWNYLCGKKFYGADWRDNGSDRIKEGSIFPHLKNTDSNFMKIISRISSKKT